MRPDYIPANKAAEQVLIGRAKAYAADCEKAYGWLLPYMTTADVARDMDSIRAALGAATINYFGYSYGTYLGQVYATLFPHRLRRMVLDSTVDPDGAWYARQHRAGLRVRGPDAGLFLLGRGARQPSTSSAALAPRSIRPGTRPAPA